MSSRCQCPFSGPADTIVGSHRDPITSEKGWLDFAVRELSRVAAGKARGQEAVWRSQCKPAWWDGACRHAWKNPTANPKDSKDTLKDKFECLVQHLRSEGQLPSDMQEEITLWEKGQTEEVFLMTSFSSLLGQASNLHSLLSDTCRKMENSGISVDPSILTHLQSCLSASVDKINAIQGIATQKNQGSSGSSAAKTRCSSERKHRRDESDSDDLSPPPKKRSKPSSSPLSSSSSFPVSPVSSSSPSSSPVSPSDLPQSSQPVQSVFSVPEQQQNTVLLARLQKQVLLKNRSQAAAAVQNVQSPTKSRSVPRSTLKKRVVAQNSENVAAAALPIHPAQPASLSASVPEFSVLGSPELRNFPNNDAETIADDDTGIDIDFWDHFLDEKSPDSILNTPDTELNCQNEGLASQNLFLVPRVSVQNETSSLTLPDSCLSQTTLVADDTENIPLSFDIPHEAVADRLVGCEMDMDNFGTAFRPDARDTVLMDTENVVVSDSGYETSSPLSHRSSLDTDASGYADLGSPSLQELLDSFE